MPLYTPGTRKQMQACWMRWNKNVVRVKGQQVVQVEFTVT